MPRAYGEAISRVLALKNADRSFFDEVSQMRCHVKRRRSAFGMSGQSVDFICKSARTNAVESSRLSTQSACQQRKLLRLQFFDLQLKHLNFSG
jgi:hypothetical protein